MGFVFLTSTFTGTFAPISTIMPFSGDLIVICGASPDFSFVQSSDS